jgi:diguanylate cyclase (GGDEF)-like protein
MNLEVLNLTLLYVEDDIDTRKSLGQFFKNKVKKLFIAKDGVEALEIFKENNIHSIISDYRMPKMDGIELAQKVKEIDPLVPFVLLTAFSDKELLINAIDAGVDKFLQKPVQANKLFTTLSSIEAKVQDKFKLEKSNICLQEAERIALLSYWNVNLRDMKIEFSHEAYKLFEIIETSSSNYMSFADVVVLEDRKKFIDIFEKRAFQEDAIDEIIAIKNSLEKRIYLHIITKQWVSSVCGDKHVIGIFQDVTNYENQRNQLIEENLTDSALQISNKKHIIIELDRLIKLSKRYGYAIGVIFFDVDNFKAINEKHGHIVADELLIELANLVKNNIRQSDLFGRWGGDEFVLVTGYSSPDSTIELAQKISNIVSKTPWKCQVTLTISTGIAFYEQNDNAYTLLEKADKKMLEAKHSGKNRYRY